MAGTHQEILATHLEFQSLTERNILPLSFLFFLLSGKISLCNVLWIELLGDPNSYFKTPIINVIVFGDEDFVR